MIHSYLEENTVKSQINTLFEARTSTQRTHLWSQQTLAVLFRRGQVFLRRARLLPIVLLLYLAYALAPLYMPSFTPSSLASTERIHYIISSPRELIEKFPLKNLDREFTPSFYSVQDFQKYLLSKCVNQRTSGLQEISRTKSVAFLSIRPK